MTPEEMRAELVGRQRLNAAMERELGPVYRGVPRPEELRVRVGEDVSHALAWKRGVDDTLAALGVSSGNPEGRERLGIPVALHDYMRDHPWAAELGDPADADADNDDDVSLALFRAVLAAQPFTNGTRVVALTADEVTELYQLCIQLRSQDPADPHPHPQALTEAASGVMRAIESHTTTV